LPHPLDQNPQAVVAVAGGPEGNVEVDLTVLLVGLVLARVHGDAAGLDDRPGTSEGRGHLGREDPDASRPDVDDLVSHDQVLEVAKLVPDPFEDLGALLEEAAAGRPSSLPPARRSDACGLPSPTP